MKETVTAEDQYKIYPDLKKEAVQELAEWIREQPDLPTPNELQVSRFLFSCYYDMENAKKCAKRYYEIKLNNPLFFSDRDILRDELQEQLDVIHYGVMPEKTPEGYTVLLHGLQVFTPSRYVFPHSCRLLGMATEGLLHRHGNMKGLVMLFDMRGVALMHLFRPKISHLKLFFQYVQEGTPLRLKQIHVVNTLPIASKIMFLIKPFVNKKLLDLLHFHSDNYEEIQQYLPKNCLPSDYGGTQPSILELHEEYKKWMLDMRDVFMEEDKEIDAFVKKRELETN